MPKRNFPHKMPEKKTTSIYKPESPYSRLLQKAKETGLTFKHPGELYKSAALTYNKALAIETNRITQTGETITVAIFMAKKNLAQWGIKT